ncbi:MAG: HAMP domain-containing histidine kinase [Planctomycetes bacterium]|nr:HAMP domain-containing histidine kinase [Planctomycetota bacterium]
MSRPLRVLALFAALAAILLAAMGYLTHEVRRLDRAEAEARRQAALEESARLALWRMESTVAPLVAQESARPYFAYTAFYPVERAYTRMFAEIEPGEIRVPSPLLTFRSPFVRLHFQMAPDGTLSSPQVPEPAERGAAKPGKGGNPSEADVVEAASRLAELATRIRKQDLAARLPLEPAESDVPFQIVPADPRRERSSQQPEPTQSQERAGQHDFQQMAQVERSTQEFQQRLRGTENVIALNRMSNQSLPLAVGIIEGPMKPFWIGEALILARRVSVDGREYIQGAWLDWPAIRAWILDGIRDLLPGADIEPALPESSEGRLLASLPVRLVAAEAPAALGGTFPTLRIMLVAAWACAILAVAAVGGLLHGAVQLAERRASFVSAVTHEMRTPLTTFRMYTEMLSEGMVPTEEKRRQYLDTLRVEAERLGHLVENVLAYARLERGWPRRRIERIAAGELLDGLVPRLSDRAALAGREIVADTASIAGAEIVADASAIERILFNLVDNACKHGAPAADARIHIEGAAGDGGLTIRVRDHGPGMHDGDAKRLFRPFFRSAREAASEAPGVGLGLALSRRLARAMGGDLRLERPAEGGGGACFELMLPVDRDR